MLSAVFMCPVILFVGDDLLQLTLTWNQKARGSVCRVPVCRLFVRACLQTITRGKRRQTGTRQSNIPRKSRQNGTRQSAVRRKSWKTGIRQSIVRRKNRKTGTRKSAGRRKSRKIGTRQSIQKRKSLQTGTISKLALGNWQCQHIGTRQTGNVSKLALGKLVSSQSANNEV